MSAIDQMLSPVSDSLACGEDLSFTPELDAVSEARRFDDPTLDQGEWVTDIKEADWGFVEAQCASLIRSRSKDLRLAVWYTEASAKTRGFGGLGDGFSLIAGLFDHYWDGLYPQSEDGDHDRRVGNLTWLLSRSVQLIREIPLTEGRGSAFSMIDFEGARSRAANAERNGSDGNHADDGVKLAVMEAARKRSSHAFYQALMADAQYCAQALDQMEKSVDARLGADGPGFSAARDALAMARATIDRFAADTGLRTSAANEAAVQADQQVANAPVADATPPAGHVNVANGPIRTRAEAIAQLRAVAEFFRRTEPHSPVAHLADKAAHWGELPLHAWLKTVIKDNAALSHVEELLGLQPPPQE
ncbi:type VI secretion system protein TssA [Herbaspirillum sp. YR522]|uniref:type VI secretion system protein TssA n=1 Tax=Herbaspirillum sp. YR522 TaxID=1144342 RepID=UPI00026FA2E5|nr:type VI secretion system protein TssA [Herbaspirillum sp. YR522]EJN00467.1 type VI secretion-associated protein, ImpA family [Herbaspirillum sp. YR522]